MTEQLKVFFFLNESVTLQCLALKTNKQEVVDFFFDEKSLKVVWMKASKIPEKSLETPETAKGVISFEEDVERMFEWMEETLKIACVNERVCDSCCCNEHTHGNNSCNDGFKNRENL